jgi:hypothetical protein
MYPELVKERHLKRVFAKVKGYHFADQCWDCHGYDCKKCEVQKRLSELRLLDRIAKFNAARFKGISYG